MIHNRRDLLAGGAALGVVLGMGAAAPAVAAGPTGKGVLSNPDATAEARALYHYLNDVWGHRTLTGQQESIWHGGPRYELDYIQQVSGKQPAVLGLDYIDPSDRGGVNRRARAWYDGGGIATICWHWGNPLVGPGYVNSKIHFDAAAALRPGTPENLAMMRDLDAIAGYLGELRDWRVPVLWRPFHEFTGDWFWWGQCGPDVFKALWTLMYDRYTRHFGLNNLIWVLGYTKDPDPAWFPGRARIDIIGADNYVEDRGPMADMYARVRAITGDAVPITMHECGPIPDPDQMTATQANWLYFLVWHSQFIRDGKTNPPDWIKAVYNSPRYVTLDQVPDLKRYGA
jgi:mannan endo-1,4-beta-mannosidase